MSPSGRSDGSSATAPGSGTSPTDRHGGRIVLSADRRDGGGPVEAVVDPGAGGRIAALRVDGRDVITTDGWGELAWGCYPMIPWTGRLRDATFEFAGQQVRVDATEPPHAIHGTTLRKGWSVVGTGLAWCEMAVDLAPEWRFGGRATHRVELGSETLRSTIEVHADQAMPVIVGWHPWFPRRLARDGAPDERAGELTLDFRPGAMLRRDAANIVTSERVSPVPPGPWDDAFVDVPRAPIVRWPGAIEIEIRADVPVWVVYDEQPLSIAVEPETGPPNGLATGDYRPVEPGAPLVATMTLAWRRPA